MKSEFGKGATFEIFPPRHQGEGLDSREGGAEVARWGRQETILVVEDNASMLKLGRITLERSGYDVLAAGTPGEAMQLAGGYAGEIALVVTDVILPEMNGRELARRLLSRRPNLKCLFMSGYTADVIARQGVLDEGVHFIRKPFTMEGITAKVSEVLDENRKGYRRPA